jgi:hypothetical protein
LKKIVIFSPFLFNDNIGSSEKLLQDFAKILIKKNDFFIYCIYGISRHKISISKFFLNHPRIKLISFSFVELCSRAPWKPKGIDKCIIKKISKINPKIFIGMVFDNYQWPIIKLPSSISLFLISPFGDFCSNGNVRKLYVSGKENYLKLKNKGISIAEIFFNPIKIPRFKKKMIQKNDPVIFGRTGRNDPLIFDSISIKAFAKLEMKFGKAVKFIYVNPSKDARELVNSLNLKRVEFKNYLNEKDLKKFYQNIHVFAHARVDGETVGISIIEAMLNCCMVITHVSKLNNEHLRFLHKPYGLVAKQNDVEGYYQHMKWCLENKDKIISLGNISKNKVKNLVDYNTVSKKIISDCTEIINEKNISFCVKEFIYYKFLILNYWISEIRYFVKKMCNFYIKKK